MKKKPDSHPVINFLSNLLDYGPIILTVIAAIVFSILANLPGYQTENGQDSTLQWILILLAFLATTQLVDRFRFLRNLDKKITALEACIELDQQRRNQILDEIPDLRERMRRAKTISISGLSLIRTSMSYRNEIQGRCNAGAHIRILMIDPSNDALLDVVSAMHEQPERQAVLRDEVRKSFGNFRFMFSATQKGKHEIRFLTSQPPYGIWIFDEGTDQAELWVEMYAYKVFVFPTLHLVRAQDKKWFDFFKNQYEKMWETSIPGNAEGTGSVMLPAA